MGEKEERNHKRRKLQVHFTVCTFALYPSVHHKPICSELWLMMRGLWCCKGTELKLYNEQFHLNQVQSHLLIRSDPHMISGYFWSGWLAECTIFKFLRENCASLLTTNVQWKWALIHKKWGDIFQTSHWKCFYHAQLCNCSRREDFFLNAWSRKWQGHFGSNYNSLKYLKIDW